MKERPQEFEERHVVHRNVKPSWNGFIKAFTYEEMVVAWNLFLNSHMKKLKHCGLRTTPMQFTYLKDVQAVSYCLLDDLLSSCTR